MAMAALRQATRRLACQQRPAIIRAAVAEQPRRLLHRGSSAAQRNFSLAEEQRRMLPRLLHGVPPAIGRTYSRHFSSFHGGEPNPVTLMEKVKEVYKISCALFELALAGVIVADCFGSQYLLLICRVMMGLEPPEKWAARLKESQCHACGEGMRKQEQKMN